MIVSLKMHYVIVERLLGLALLVEDWTALLEPLVLELGHLRETNV